MTEKIGIVITTVLGDSREVTRYYDNGFDCPYCSYPVQYPKMVCENSSCEANIFWKPEVLREYRAKRAAEKERRDRDERNRQWSMAYSQERFDAHKKWEQEQISKAKEMGACLGCLFQPGWERVKFIRHRKRCPKEIVWDIAK